MNRSELEHILRASAEITGEKEFVLIGSQAILGQIPDAPRSLRESEELDIYPKHRPEKSEMIDGAIGEMSDFHKTHKIYAHGIGPETATLPFDWESRLVKVQTEGTKGATGWCLDVHDIAYSKLAAGREKDLRYVAELRRNKLISPSKMNLSISKCGNAELKEMITQRWRKIQMQQALDESKSVKPSSNRIRF